MFCLMYKFKERENTYMWVNISIILIIIVIFIALLSIPYRDGYRKAYIELTDAGMGNRKAKIISSVFAFFYIF